MSDESARKRAFELLDWLSDHSWAGCSNHGCKVTGGPIGMGTNGVCKCYRNMADAALELAVLFEALARRTA